MMGPSLWHRACLSLLGTLTAILVLTATLAPAQAQSSSAAEDLKTFAAGIIFAMNGAAGPRGEAPGTVRRILSQGVDLDAIASYVLGDHQTAASAAQLDRFGALYNQYLLKMLSGLLLDKQAKNLTVIESKSHEGATSVLSEVELASGETMEWRWLMRKDGPGHRVVDLQTHGISLASMLKFEVDSVIRRKGFNKFLDELQRRL